MSIADDSWDLDDTDEGIAREMAKDDLLNKFRADIEQFTLDILTNAKANVVTPEMYQEQSAKLAVCHSALNGLTEENERLKSEVERWKAEVRARHEMIVTMHESNNALRAEVDRLTKLIIHGVAADDRPAWAAKIEVELNAAKAEVERLKKLVPEDYFGR